VTFTRIGFGVSAAIACSANDALLYVSHITERLSEDAQDTTTAGGAVYNLTAVQKTTIQSLLAERNASCSYNMTVASLLLEG
jgi:hypothetical protein